MIQKVLLFQLSKIKTNRFTFLLIVLTAIITLYIGYRHDTMKQSLAYLAVMWLCSFFIDFYALKKQVTNPFIVRQPKKETFYFFMCFILGMLFLFVRFSGLVDWDHLNPILKLASIPLILFVFPIGLAVILLVLKYKPSHLGIRFQGFILVIPILLLSIITNQLLSPESFTWYKAVEAEGGIVATLLSGFIVAGLSEEFFRVVGQTRLGAYLKNFGIGWFVTTLVWALMHTPKWYSEDHSIETLLSAIRIIPIGLMWGYLTHRTKSILPSVIVHGLNVWGLQNF